MNEIAPHSKCETWYTDRNGCSCRVTEEQHDIGEHYTITPSILQSGGIFVYDNNKYDYVHLSPETLLKIRDSCPERDNPNYVGADGTFTIYKTTHVRTRVIDRGEKSRKFDYVDSIKEDSDWKVLNTTFDGLPPIRFTKGDYTIKEGERFTYYTGDTFWHFPVKKN